MNKYLPQDFYDAFGITEADLSDCLAYCYADFTWQDVCERAADAANAKLEKENADKKPTLNDPQNSLACMKMIREHNEKAQAVSDMLALLVRVQKLESEVERLKNETI